ncbi:Hypothetical protein FKW44_004147, partial [Caligus rogercresseyi]
RPESLKYSSLNTSVHTVPSSKTLRNQPKRITFQKHSKFSRPNPPNFEGVLTRFHEIAFGCPFGKKK